MCQTEKIKELKYLVRGIEFEFTDEEILKYIKSCPIFYSNIKEDMKDNLIVKYFEQKELEDKEKIKNDFLTGFNELKSKNI